ncbi:MAG TPA: sensor domain-containing protein [Plantibacter sp.]|uniref:sensor histidine kinase n=2 Tax=unclassified Plantibacter TaxID=2624265 RepID=UPI002BA38B92|nr:sensor domain-containing protein [Plantibacter sp.]
MTAMTEDPTRRGPVTTEAAATTDRVPNLLVRYGALWRALPGSLLFLLPTLPIVIVGLSLAVSMTTLGAGLAILGIGLLVLVGVLWICRGFADLERLRLRTTGLPPIDPPVWHSTRAATTRFGTVLSPLTGGRWWLALLHTVFVNPVVGTLTWSVTITWVAGALGGLSQWFWNGFLPDRGSSVRLHEVIWGAVLPNAPLPADANAAENVLSFAFGIVFLATSPLVLRGLVILHHRIAVGMLGAWPQEALRVELDAATRARGAAVAAEAGAVKRLERDIHDGPQQRLIRLQMDLAAAERRLDADPETARGLISEARTQAADALEELRALSKGLMPPLLQDRGLVPALDALATGSPVRTTTELAVLETVELGVEDERGIYFVVAELLTNVAKHARADRAAIVAQLRATPEIGRVLTIRVVDDGHGGARMEPGHGLAGLADRAQGLGGLLVVEPTPIWNGAARGSSVAVTVPVR